MLECLEQKASDGVEVRIIYDGLGSPMASSKSYQKYLAKRGIKSHIFQPLVPFFNTKQNNRDHRKIVVIDGEIAYTGGLNLSNEYFNEGENRFAYWKDNAIRIEGPAIRNLTTMFLQTWNIQTHKEDDYAKYILTWVVHNVADLKTSDVEFVFKTESKSAETQMLFNDIKALEKHHSIVKLGTAKPRYIKDKAFWELYKELNLD